MPPFPRRLTSSSAMRIAPALTRATRGPGLLGCSSFSKTFANIVRSLSRLATWHEPRLHGPGLQPGQVWPRRLSRPWRLAGSSSRSTRGVTSRACTAARSGPPSAAARSNYRATAAARRGDDHPRALDPGARWPVPGRRPVDTFRLRNSAIAVRGAWLLRDHEAGPVPGRLRRGGVLLAQQIVQVGEQHRAGAGGLDPIRLAGAARSAARRPTCRATSGCASPSRAPQRRTARTAGRPYYGQAAATGTRTARLGAAARGSRHGACQGLGFRPEVTNLYEHEADLLSSEPPSGPAVLLIDPWAVRTPLPAHARAFDELDKPWVQVVVVWNRRTPDAERKPATAGRPRRRPAEHPQGRPDDPALAARGVPTLEDFSLVTAAVIATAGRQYLRYAPSRRRAVERSRDRLTRHGPFDPQERADG